MKSQAPVVEPSRCRLHQSCHRHVRFPRNERLATQYGWDIQLYSQRVEDIPGITFPSNSDSSLGTGRIVWHRVSQIPGPHLVKFIWWFLANHIRRRRDRSSQNTHPDVTYSPGINCLDADAIIVHMVFHEFYARVRAELRLRSLPLRTWPVILHRRLYYNLIMFLERRVYSNSKVRLAAVSQLVASQLSTYFGRADVAIIPSAVDTSRFSCSSRLARRPRSRALFNFSDDDFVLLLIGNDWKVKSLDQLLRAIEVNPNLPLRLLVVGRDESSLYATRLRLSKIESRVTFQQPSSDVLQFYAAADAYVGPSLQDSFGLPVLEAMACGLPVISSVRSGVSAFITHGQNGLLLRDPERPEELVALLKQLFEDNSLQQKLGVAAAETAAMHTWDRNAELAQIFLVAAAIRPSF
jgi:glycosyltransferase involved in cell wall biosynthesis